MELESLLKKKDCRMILRFFHENPACIETGRGVATWINSQDIKKVRLVLKKLANEGLLIAHKVSTTIGYSYTRDKKTISKIARILKKYG